MNINIEILKRNIKLQMLNIGKLSNKEKLIINTLNKHLGGLNSYTSNTSRNSLFFGKDVKNISMEYNITNSSVWVKHTIWRLIKKELELKNMEIEDIIKWWCDDNLQLNEPICNVFDLMYDIDLNYVPKDI